MTMDPIEKTAGFPAYDPALLHQEEAAAMATYQRLIDRFPDEAILKQCRQGHADRCLALEKWLHQQCISLAAVPADDPFSQFPAELFAGSIDHALSHLAACEEHLLERYIGFAHLAVTAPSGLDRLELLTGQRLTVHAVSVRLRHALL